FGAEIPVAERWALSIERSWLDPRSELLPISGDFDWTRIGPNYLLQNIDGWQPYLAAGVGRNKLDIGSGNSELTWDFGVGVKKFFADNWFGRADYKLIRITDLNTWDNAVSVGVGYAFGAKAAARPVAAAPAAAPAPQPAPEVDT